MNKFIHLLLCALLVTGCAPGVIQMPDRLNRLESEVAAMREAQAQRATEIASFEADLRALSGKVEEMGHYQQEVVGRDFGQVKEALERIRTRVPPPSLVPTTALESDEITARGLSPEVSSAFAGAFADLRLGGYSSALKGLQKALEFNAGDEWGALAYFWIGVSYEGVEALRDSLGAYMEVSNQYPKSPRSPLALHRAAGILQKLGDRKVEKLTLQKLLATSPKGELADLARKRMKAL